MMSICSSSPDALSPQTLHATKVFVLVDELDELESAADEVVVVFEDDVGENGWASAMKWNKRHVKLLISFKTFRDLFDLLASA